MKLNILLSLSFLLLFACNKMDNDLFENEPDTPAGTFSAKIDGKLFDSPTSAVAILSEIDTSVLNLNIFQLTGIDLLTNGYFKNLSILFSGDELNLVEGTYDSEDECNLNEVCPAIIYVQQSELEDDPEGFASSSNAPGGNFTITFSELDFRVGGKAVGTFSAKVYDESDGSYHEITEGKFNLPIQ